MGKFSITIIAQGGHGCSRATQSGEKVYGCRSMTCPDCRTREFIDRLKETGSIIESAELAHWPGQAAEVKDDLKTGIRTGSFPK